MAKKEQAGRDALKNAARDLLFKGQKVKEVATALKISERTIYHWKETEGWGDVLQAEAPEQAIARRYALLVARENKTREELKELDVLMGHLERFIKARLNQKKSREQWNFHGEDPATAPQSNRARPSNKKPAKNDVSAVTAEFFDEKLVKTLFEYQNEWNLTRQHRNRIALKSRQIGFTWNEALQSFKDACLTGDNQIFLSATRAQANVFRDYIVEFAAAELGVTLTGNPIKLKTANGFSNLYFLSNNSKSAQSYHGHVTIDEIFWIAKFMELFELATAMASHAKWRRTLLSTPSIITHPAYKLWSGALWQKRFKNPKPWPDFKTLQKGLLCDDTWYRKIITLQDAIKGGCNLFDLKQLKLENAPNVFRQLYECQFIDDAAGVFSFEVLQKCMADPDDWTEFKPKQTQPVGRRPVWGGYDPARYRDDASLSILLPPLRPDEPIKVLERFRWTGKSYLWQVEKIRELTQKYTFNHFGIDTTGPGIGVWENVHQFLPCAIPITYTATVKPRLVLKAVEVMEQGRLLFDAADTGLAHAFLTIKQSSTDSDHITYTASRNADTGHADAAFSVMHALAAEPLGKTNSGVIISVGA